MASITAANSTLLLAITGLFPAPQRLQGYATDDIYSTEPLDSAEVLMGVDGKLSGGFVFVPVKQSYNLQADSNSNAIFEAWYAAQQALVDIYKAQATIALPSLGKKWAMTNGILTSFPPMPDAGKTLKPRKYGITWESISPSPI